MKKSIYTSIILAALVTSQANAAPIAVNETSTEQLKQANGEAQQLDLGDSLKLRSEVILASILKAQLEKLLFIQRLTGTDSQTPDLQPQPMLVGFGAMGPEVAIAMGTISLSSKAERLFYGPKIRAHYAETLRLNTELDSVRSEIKTLLDANSSDKVKLTELSEKFSRDASALTGMTEAEAVIASRLHMKIVRRTSMVLGGTIGFVLLSDSVSTFSELNVLSQSKVVAQIKSLNDFIGEAEAALAGSANLN